MVNDKVRKPSDEPEMSKSVECDTFSLKCSDTFGWVAGSISGL